MATSKLQALWNHPAGPKTSVIIRTGDLVYRAVFSAHLKIFSCSKFTFIITLSVLSRVSGTLKNFSCSRVHFWAPTFKWGISIANVADFAKPPENLSYPQQIAVACTGVVWSRYSTVITPKNWNLFSVNVAMAGTGLYQLSRKIRHDYFSEKEAAVAEE